MPAGLPAKRGQKGRKVTAGNTGRGNTGRGNTGRTARSDPSGSPRSGEDATPKGMRLNRYIARAGVCSRREADGLIERGLVKVNGERTLEFLYFGYADRYGGGQRETHFQFPPCIYPAQ